MHQVDSLHVAARTVEWVACTFQPGAHSEKSKIDYCEGVQGTVDRARSEAATGAKSDDSQC